MSDEREYDSEDIMQFADKEPAESATEPIPAKDARTLVEKIRSGMREADVDEPLLTDDEAAAEIERFAREREVRAARGMDNIVKITQTRAEAAEALAYIGEHHSPDQTWKARCDELVADLRKAEAEAKALREALEAVLKLDEDFIPKCECGQCMIARAALAPREGKEKI